MENILSVSVLVFEYENILFIKSQQQNGRIKLVLPGGKVRANENIEDCAVRQVKEAAGINIKLDKKLSGVIMRRNKEGSFLSTFVFLAEAVDRAESQNAIYLPYKNVEYYKEISGFSRLIIRKLRSSSLSGMDRSELYGKDGREYLMYF